MCRSLRNTLNLGRSQEKCILVWNKVSQHRFFFSCLMWKRWSREVCIPQYQALITSNPFWWLFTSSKHSMTIGSIYTSFSKLLKNRNNVIQIHIAEELGSVLKWRDGKLYVLVRWREIANPLFFCIKTTSPRWPSNKTQSI